MATQKPDPATLADDAWKMIQEALGSGTITLGDGASRTLETKDIIRVVQWLATLKARKPKVVASPEDFNLKRTEK